MTTTPITPRAALLAFARYLDENEFPAPLPSHVYAKLVREYAFGYPDDPHAPGTPPAGPSGVSAAGSWAELDARYGALRDEVERLRLQVAGEPIPGVVELVGGPALDRDELLRVEALQAAAHWHIGSTLDDEDAGPQTVIDTAHAFEGYLRGDR